MNHLVRFTSVAAFGGWLVASAAWAGDAKETPAPGRATASVTASGNTSAIEPATIESAKVETATSNRPTAVTDTPPDQTARASIAAGGGSTATSAHEGSAPLKAHDHIGTADDVMTSSSDPLAAAVIDDAALSSARGGADTHTNQNTSTGAVTGNVASQLNTGSNTISDGSFANTSGIPIVIQNSGNNVLIQNSTILNLQLESPK
jgi:hypothetical protein